MGRSLEAEQVAQLVQHTKVQSGEWKSPYHIFDWQMIESLPGKFQPAVKMAEMILNPRHDWEAEAFRIEDDTLEITSLHLAMKSHGGAPLNAPLFGRPALKLREVVSPILASLIEKFPIRLRYREFLLMEFPVIFALQPEGTGEGFCPDLIPAYDRVIIKPFWFFEGEGDKEKAVAEDPFRLVFNISGAPIGYMLSQLRGLGISDERINRVLFRKVYSS